MRIVVAFFLTIMATGLAQAQVAQWNQFVADEALEQAFYRALREVSVEYINQADAAGRPAVIAFVDSQLDYPLQLTSSNFRHNLINATHSKLSYLLRYQAKSTAGADIPLGSYGGLLVGGVSEKVMAKSGAAMIPGDGGMMICPINKDGLEFMFGGLAITSMGENYQLRSAADGADIIAIHDRILALTYEYYGHVPDGGQE